MMEKVRPATHVLIVDDDKAILFLHELRVKQSRIADRISRFSSAREAFDFLTREGLGDMSCIILLDINMPEVSGWDFLRLLEDADPAGEIYVVMVTSSIQKADRQKAGQFHRVVHYLEKPLNRERIEELKKVERIKHLFTVQENNLSSDK